MKQTLKLGIAVALMAALTGAPAAQKDTAPPESKPDPYRLQINRWAKDAKITREKKALKDVKKGTYLDLADLLATQLNPITVFAGKVGVQEIQKETTVRYVSIKPPKLNPAEDLEFISEILGGEIFNRISILTAKGTCSQKIKGKIASSKGTAYSVREVGAGAEVLVAEGEVAVQLDGGGGELRVRAREKATVNQTLPAAAIPVTEADESKIRALLSLPILTLTGYSDPIELRRKDAEDIVTLGVRNGFLKVTEPDDKVSRTRPNTLFISGKALTFITPTGDSVDIKNAEFMGAAQDGSVLVVYITGEGLWSFDKYGKKLVKMNDAKPQDFALSPDGRVAFWLAPSTDNPGTNDFVRSDPFTGYHRTIPSNFPPDSMYVEWRQGSRLPFLVGKSGNVYFVVNPAPAGLPFTTEESIQQAFLLTGSSKPGISPHGDWIWFSAGQGKYKFARTSDGKEFDVTSKTEPRFLPQEKLAGNVSEAVVLTDTNDQSYAIDPEAPSVQIALPANTAGLTAYQTSATSPNGELVTFRNPPTHTAFVADSQNLGRDSDTYVGIGSKYRCGWLDGNEVWYEDEFAGTPESIIITLGIKKVGALPGGPGTVSGEEGSGIQDLAMLGDGGYPINEYNVSNIAEDGTVVAIVKFDFGMTGGIGSTLSGAMSQLEDFGLPFDRGKDGSILLNGYALTGTNYRLLKRAESDRDAKERETGKKDDKWNPPDGLYDYRPLVWRPGKGLIQIPNDSVKLNPSPVILDDGKVFLSGVLWDPLAKGDFHYLTAEPPYGGEIVYKSTSVEALVSVARNGKRVFAKKGGSGTYELWLDATDEKGTRLTDTRMRRASSQLIPESKDGISSTPTLTYVSIADDGTVYWLESTTQMNRLHVLPKGAEETNIDVGAEMVLNIFAVNKDLCVGFAFGAHASSTNDGSKGFVCWRGRVYLLSDLLPKEWSFHMLRAVSRNGLISGSFFYNGEPRIAVFDLKKLLRGR